MLKIICSWIAAILMFICLAPLLAYAVSVHSDFGIIFWQRYSRE